MYSFKNDYSEGAHPLLLEALCQTNLIQEDGYGEDQYSLKAQALIRRRAKSEDVHIHFLAGGTQTNRIAIASMLRPHEAVIAVDSGHILVHETGAIEASGHKVISAEGRDGKLLPESIQKVVEAHRGDEHMVKPRLVYVSNATELGTTYTREELESLRRVCDLNDLLLYLDGARLGAALCSEENDLDFQDLPRLTDAFYIGGTKNGALLGEALVLCNPDLKKEFRYHMKQQGALMAKGRILGLQFLTLFENDLYFDLACQANARAMTLKKAIQEIGFSFLVETGTNQIFPIFPDKIIDVLEKKFAFYRWQKMSDQETAVRLVTSWATPEAATKAFIDLLKDLKEGQEA